LAKASPTKATLDPGCMSSGSAVEKKNPLIFALSKSRWRSTSQEADSTAKSANAVIASSASDVQSASSPSNSHAPSSSAIQHERLQLTFSQSTCPICLEDYVSGESTVRELPCRHIFHPDCVDTFLLENSSLCPVCKKSVLPAGYCPERVTDLMVRQERFSRRIQRQRRGLDSENGLPMTTTIPRAQAGSEQQEAPVPRGNLRDSIMERSRRSRRAEARVGVPQMTDQSQSETLSRQPGRGDDAAGRQERMRRRAVEMLDPQSMPEVDAVETEASRPKWLRVIHTLFPIFR